MKTISGQLIAFFGPDGSGKSTTATLLAEMCSDQGIVTYRYHWRPRVLPSLNKARFSHHDVTRPDELPTRPWLASLFIYAYFFLDFTWAYLVKFRPLMKRGVVIIYERYYYDVLFHPKRYKLQPIASVGNILSRFVPKPDLIILMCGDSPTIHNRKPELPIEEIVRQQKEMKNQLVNFGVVLNVNVTTAEPEECAVKIFSAIGKS